MAIINMFASRYKSKSKKITIPQPFRIQTVHIINDLIGVYRKNGFFVPLYQSIHIPYDLYCRESGKLGLREHQYTVIPQDFYGPETSGFNSLVCLMIDSQSNSEVLNILELIFRFFHFFPTQYSHADRCIEQSGSCFEELNERLSYHEIELQFENGSLIPIGSKGIYSEIIHPGLNFLTENPDFEVPQKEILEAFEHLRHGKYKAAISMGGNSVESTLKVICSQKEWKYTQNANMKELLKIIRDNNLIPKVLDDHFSQLRQLLQNSSGAVRNEYGSHGGGTKDVSPTKEIAEYALHLCLSNINFLIRQAGL